MRVIVTISTGRNAVTSATLKLSAPGNGRFLTKQAQFAGVGALWINVLGVL